MIRILLILAAVCAYATSADARPRHHHRHHARQAAQECVFFCDAFQPQRARSRHERRLAKRGAYIERRLPIGRARYTDGAIGSRPSGCPARAWCGCWLAQHLGISNRSLWLARNWAGIGSNAGGPKVGAIVVWAHHVGKITAVEGSRIRVLSGNDGHAVRDRWRTTSGVIAYRVAG